MSEPTNPYWFVRKLPPLELGQAECLEHTRELAEKRLDQAIADIVRQELHKSGSQTNPETLAERLREVRRRKEVLDDIRGFEDALDAAGKS